VSVDFAANNDVTIERFATPRLTLPVNVKSARHDVDGSDLSFQFTRQNGQLHLTAPPKRIGDECNVCGSRLANCSVTSVVASEPNRQRENRVYSLRTKKGMASHEPVTFAPHNEQVKWRHIRNCLALPTRRFIPPPVCVDTHRCGNTRTQRRRTRGVVFGGRTQHVTHGVEETRIVVRLRFQRRRAKDAATAATTT
jgi:hypothetical protein